MALDPRKGGCGILRAGLYDVGHWASAVLRGTPSQANLRFHLFSLFGDGGIVADNAVSGPFGPELVFRMELKHTWKYGYMKLFEMSKGREFISSWVLVSTWLWNKDQNGTPHGGGLSPLQLEI